MCIRIHIYIYKYSRRGKKRNTSPKRATYGNFAIIRRTKLTIHSGVPCSTCATYALLPLSFSIFHTLSVSLPRLSPAVISLPLPPSPALFFHYSLIVRPRKHGTTTRNRNFLDSCLSIGLMPLSSLFQRSVIVG